MQMKKIFSKIPSTDPCSPRCGILQLNGVAVETPVFMPVGTQATVKTMDPSAVAAMGYRLILGNTYHLMLRPGEKIIQDFGGLQKFMAWHGAILTDSGGFQVFSLSDLNKIEEDGVHFRSHIDGGKWFMTPERSIGIQTALGSDIIMAFDVCTPWPCEKTQAENSMNITHRWAERCVKEFSLLQEKADEADPSPMRRKPSMFGIVQGSTFNDLREISASTLAEMPFHGYGIGGLSVGEPPEIMMEMLANTTPFLPVDKPRYLMGVGSPVELMDAVALGVDMFDCVLPTRLARHGAVMTRDGRINIKNARFKQDHGPIEEGCECSTCRRFSRAYVRHLFAAGETLGPMLATTHNLQFLYDLMAGARKAIKKGQFEDYRKEFKNRWNQNTSKPENSGKSSGSH